MEPNADLPDRPLNWRPVANVLFFVVVGVLAVASEAFTIFVLTFSATSLLLMEVDGWRKRRARMTYHVRSHRRHPRTRWSDR